MFKFDFDIDDIDEEISSNIVEDSQSPKAPVEDHPQAPFQEHSIQQFVRLFLPFLSHELISLLC